VNALASAKVHLLNGKEQLLEFRAGELLAEELRLAQLVLEQITGRFSSDDLLGKIFSEFCIGK
jgi:tRNA modification GTPase